MAQVQAPDVSELANGDKNVRVPLTRKEQIEAELKLLEWHKLANNAAIKGALLQTKETKHNSPQKPPQHARDDAKWIKKVIKQEHIRPLEVSKDFVLEYERREKENADRLASQVDRHISTLKTLRSKLEARHDLKSRTAEYREWQREFLPKKHAVMIGKTLDEIEPTDSDRNQKPEDEGDREINDELMRKEYNRSMNKGSSSQELSTVLDSLSRLAELEQRISGLEKENRYDALVAAEQPGATQRTSIEFRRRRTQQPVAPNAPKGMMYQVKMKQKSQQHTNWRVNMPAAGGGSAAVRAKQMQRGTGTRKTSEYGDDFEADDSEREGPGIFITEGGGAKIYETTRDAQRRERARQAALASAGQKNLKSRVQTKRLRAKEQMMGAKKHEEAMKEMARRKAENLKKGVPGAARNARMQQQRAGGRASMTKGASSGVRNKNKHLQDFEQMKSIHRKRKDEIQRKEMRRADPVRKVRQMGPNKGAIGQRFVSQTAPAYRSARPNNGAIGGVTGRSVGGAAGSRMPNTKGSGTTTRRTDAPMRRPKNSNNHYDNDPLSKIPSTAPPIAVTGMSGLRVIKAGGINTTKNQQQQSRRVKR